MSETKSGGNLIEEIQRECQRLREDVIPAYESIGPAGRIGLMFLRAAVSEGEASVAEMDTVRMVKALASLRGCEA